LCRITAATTESVPTESQQSKTLSGHASTLAQLARVAYESFKRDDEIDKLNRDKFIAKINSTPPPTITEYTILSDALSFDSYRCLANNQIEKMQEAGNRSTNVKSKRKTNLERTRTRSRRLTKSLLTLTTTATNEWTRISGGKMTSVKKCVGQASES